LARRVSQARAAGIQVKTLVPRVASVERHIDLVVKQSITAISGVGSQVVSNRQLHIPRAIHYGVWELPVTGRLPVQAKRLIPVLWANWSIWRQIRRASMEAATYHLVIDALALAEEGPAAVKTLSRLMRRVAELKTRGILAVETLSAAADRLSAVPLLSPQRSILRRAA
jgi:hypothetical protein